MLLRMAADQERADRIRALKLERPDLTWRRIADYVGVTERSATDWQKKGGIDYANAEKLATLFEVDVDYIWRGPAEGERAPSPFAGQDALADRFDSLEAAVREALHQPAIEDKLAGILAQIQTQLAEQTDVLRRIEARLAQDERATAETEEATQRLLGAVDVASQALRAEAPRSAKGRAPRAK